MSGYHAFPLQEDHTRCGGVPHPDAVLPVGMLPDVGKHPSRLSKGTVRTVLRIRLCVGVWRGNLPGPGRDGVFLDYGLLSL